MVRGRGGQPTRGGRSGNQMGTRGGRVAKNVSNLDFGFSSQTKTTYGRGGGGYSNNANPSNTYGGGQQQQQSNYGNNAVAKRYNNNNNAPNNNGNTNSRYNAGSNNQQFSGNNNPRGNNYNQNKVQGQSQNYNASAANRNANNANQGYNQNQSYNNKQNQGYNKQQNQNYNKPAAQYNNNGNNSGYVQRVQNSNQNQGYSNNANNNPGFDNFGQQGGGNQNFDGPKPSLLGSHPINSGPPSRNEPSSDDILKEIGKVFLTSMTGPGGPQGVNPMMQQKMMNMMGPGGPPPNPSPYDNFYNDGNQFTNYNPPMFNNYRGGYNPRGRGGMMNQRGGVGNSRGAMRGGRPNNPLNKNNPQNKRVQGTPQAGVKRQSFKSKNNQNNKAGNKVAGKTTLVAKTLASKSLKYSLLQLHKSVEEDSQPLAAFLRQTFYDLSSDNKTHFLLLSRILLKHQNVVKLLTYEVKKSMDKKFGEANDEEILKKKLDLLKEKKTKFFTEYKANFKDATNMENKEKLVDDALPVLAGESFTDEHVPKPEDYVANPDTKEEEYINAFKIAFFKTCFEKFLYRMNNTAMPSKNVEKRLKFYVDNGFLSHLIVDKVKLKSNAKLPAVLLKYSKPIVHGITKTKIEASTKSSYENMVKQGEQVQTDISDIIGGEKVSAEVLRDFADCIILFDRIATSIKFKLLGYTPYINLTADQKKSIFNDLVTAIYSTAFDVLKNKVKTSEKTFVDMEKDEEKVEETVVDQVMEEDEDEAV